MKSTRKSGVLLHISSLPSKYGCGDLGVEAYKFIDTLCENEFSVWQILPLGPLGPGNSPYQAYSAYAGDPIYISPDELLGWGLLNADDFNNYPIFNKKSVEFDKVIEFKENLFKTALDNFKISSDFNLRNEYSSFLDEHGWWLNDYALFIACEKHFEGECWNQWEKELALKTPLAVEQYQLILHEEIEFEKFKQFLFMRQWFRLKNYANQKGIKFFGDLPLYVSLNSADVWSNQEMFLLNDSGIPTMVGGVPPDYFSEDGQLWGNPLYNWEKLEQNNFHWWIARIYFNLHLFDLVRIDHFRGLESFWAIPSDSKTAKEGNWMPAKGFEMLSLLKSQLGELPIIAEDLGIITPEVEHLRDYFNLPGMKVLQFAFTSNNTNVHLPHNFTGRNVIYTGTHDNNTTIGWWGNIDTIEKSNANNYLKKFRGDVLSIMLDLAWGSTAELAVVPMQDILQLGSCGRMNTPGTPTGNWNWRYTKKQVKKEYFERFRTLNIKFNRCGK